MDGVRAGVGEVEVFRYGIWGPVRDLTDNDATVICRELGYSQGIAIAGHVFRPPTEARIVALGGQCSGTETSFIDCASSDRLGWDTEVTSASTVACANGTGAG